MDHQQFSEAITGPGYQAETAATPVIDTTRNVFPIRPEAIATETTVPAPAETSAAPEALPQVRALAVGHRITGLYRQVAEQQGLPQAA